MNYWLMKSEPDECSIDDVLAAPQANHALVRRAQLPGAQLHARRDAASATACCSTTRAAPSRASPASPKWPRRAYPDATQFDRKSKYYDPKATRDEPRWFCVDVRASRKTRLVPLAELPRTRQLADMVVLRRGNRLSITPVSRAEWRSSQEAA